MKILKILSVILLISGLGSAGGWYYYNAFHTPNFLAEKVLKAYSIDSLFALRSIKDRTWFYKDEFARKKGLKLSSRAVDSYKIFQIPPRLLWYSEWSKSFSNFECWGTLDISTDFWSDDSKKIFIKVHRDKPGYRYDKKLGFIEYIDNKNAKRAEYKYIMGTTRGTGNMTLTFIKRGDKWEFARSEYKIVAGN